MSLKREPIKLPEETTYSSVYVADTYTGKRPNKNQRHLQPYYLDMADVKVCYFPIGSFGRREPSLNLTRELMENCVERGIPIVLETKTGIPDWAIDKMSKVRGSVLIIQMPSISVTMRRRFFHPVGDPEDIRTLILKVFQTGTNVRLKFAPIVPTITKMSELTAYMISMRSFINGVDVGFSRLIREDIERIEKRNRLQPGELELLYTEDNGEFFLKEHVKDEMMGTLRVFCEGNNIDLTETW